MICRLQNKIIGLLKIWYSPTQFQDDHHGRMIKFVGAIIKFLNQD